MRVFTRTTKVLGVTATELDILTDMVREARDTGKAERMISSTEVLAVEVKDVYGWRSEVERVIHTKGH